MSAGGVFTLIANDGKADRMIMATKLLNSRIKDIMCLRVKSGFDDPTPTLVDIEKTHILFVNAHFKPFAAIGYEYNKVQQTAGSPAFGNEITFSIPNFGDFFHDMVAHVQLAEVTTTEGTVPNVLLLPLMADSVRNTTGSPSGEAAGLPLSVADNFVVDGQALAATRAAAVALGLDSYEVHRWTRRFVDASCATAYGGSGVSNYVKYCDLPGLRLFEKVKFNVNGNPLDEYDTVTYLFYDKFNVQPNKRVGWNRLVGQEVPIAAISDLVSHGRTEILCGEGSLDVNGDVVGLDARNDYARETVGVLNGPQTPKLVQPALAMWVPLLFWFNLDPRLSIASVSIPYGQRLIQITLAPRNRILFLAPGNLYLQTKTECFTLNTAGSAAGANWSDLNSNGDETTNYCVSTVEQPWIVDDSVLSTLSAGEVNVTLYINNIFVNPEIHDIYIKRIGFSLIRVHRLQTERAQRATASTLLSQFKWPVETIYFAARPTYNIAAANPQEARDWHLFSRLHDEHVYESGASTVAVPAIADTTEPESQAALIAAGIVGCNSVCVSKNFTYPKSEATVDTIVVRAHGINIYDLNTDDSATFFSKYSPYIWGGRNIQTPDDEGAYMINFCLYPGTYQPSGHINISRAREFYIDTSSSYIARTDSNNTADDYDLAPGESVREADLLFLGIAINFLLVSDGSAVLRYST